MCFQINCRAIILNHTLTRRARSNAHKKQHDSVSPSFFERSPKYFRNVKKMNAMFECRFAHHIWMKYNFCGRCHHDWQYLVQTGSFCYRSSLVFFLRCLWRSNIIFRTMIKQPLHDFQLPFVTSNIWSSLAPWSNNHWTSCEYKYLIKSPSSQALYCTSVSLPSVRLPERLQVASQVSGPVFLVLTGTKFLLTKSTQNHISGKKAILIIIPPKTLPLWTSG